jgi:hypothetical protein
MCDNFDNFLRRLAFAMSSTFLYGHNSPFSRSLASKIPSASQYYCLCSKESLCKVAAGPEYKDDFDFGSMAHPPSLTRSFPIPDAWLTLDTSYHSLFLQSRRQEIRETRHWVFSFVQYVNRRFYSNERFFDRFCSG